MDSILTTINGPGNELLKITLLSLAAFRIYLEIIGFDFKKLPLTAKVASFNSDNILKFHKMGLIFSIGYIIFNAPSILLSSV